ncbi:CAP domain-containing protein [Streptomyces sp. NPDC004667]|uniref:CAP domain-containing protein n=1 Tax=Streptomyces sp. NPDC004667 TaxID=3154285 RepID=UPI0033ADF525
MGRHGTPRRAGGRSRVLRTVLIGTAAVAVAGTAMTVVVDSAGGHHVRAASVSGEGRGDRAPLAPNPFEQGLAESGRKASGAGQGTGDGAGTASGARSGSGPASASGSGSGKSVPGGATGSGAPKSPTGAAEGSSHAAVAVHGAPRRESLPRTPAAAAAAAEELVNEARAEAGCSPLTVSPVLSSLAAAHSKDMALHGYFSSTGPDGSTPWTRSARAGVQGLRAENIARGPADPQALLNQWTAQPGSRANLLDCGDHSMGIGAYFNDVGFWWTEDFAA